MSSHLTSSELEEFSQLGGADRPLRAKVIRHLLGGCHACRDRLRALNRVTPPQASESPKAPRASPHAEHYDYGRAFARAEHVASLFLSGGTPRDEPPGEILAELFAASTEGALGSENRFAIPALVKWLTNQSHRSRYTNVQEMLHWGLLGRLAADACTPEVAGSPQRLADLRARGWGQFGNALRVSGRIAQAEEALNAACRYRSSGTGDPTLRARLNEQLTALCIFQRDFETAQDLSREAGRIYLNLEDTHRSARAAVQEAIIFIYSGKPHAALKILQKATPWVNAEIDPYLATAARHNLVRCYLDLGRPDLAHSSLLDAKKFSQTAGDDFIILRSAWHEGQISASLGFSEAAQRSLLAAWKGFLERGLAFEVAVIAHDLVGVLQQTGDLGKLRQVVRETSSKMAHMHPSKEALASWHRVEEEVNELP